MYEDVSISSVYSLEDRRTRQSASGSDNVNLTEFDMTEAVRVSRRLLVYLLIVQYINL